MLKRTGTLISFFIFCLMGCAQPTTVNTTFPNQNQKSAVCVAQSIPNEYVIHWKSGQITKSAGAGRDELISSVVQPRIAEIHFVEPNYKLTVDTYRSKSISTFATTSNVLNWNVTSTSAAAAWNAGATGAGIVVAVIDSGVDVTHSQLASQIYTNLTEANGKVGVDDDGNGYVDDIHGWNFTNNSPTQNDQIGHGTHVSGTIAATHVNAQEPMGFAPQAKILPVQFIGTEASGGTTYDAIRAIQYASSMGAQVMNASWGSSSCSQTLQSVISSLDSKNVLFVTAAGNSSNDLTKAPEYPAAFQGTHQITVAATAQEFLRAGFSNFGSLVQVGAPGMDIISTYPGNSYATMDGTSMASPAVAGEAAAIWSASPSATASQVRAAILAGIDSGITGVLTGGQINVQKALAALAKSSPTGR